MQHRAPTRTAVRTAIAAVGLASVQTLSADIIPGALYGVNNEWREQFLAIIDKTDASLTNIGPTGIEIDGLAVFQAATIFAADNTDSQLVTLDPDTGGIASVVGSFGNRAFIEGMAFRPSDGVLFGIDSRSEVLVTINSSTGEVSTVGSYGGPRNMAGISFVGSTLYGVDWADGGLYEINQSTGQASIIGFGEAGSNGGPLGLATDPTDGSLFTAEWRDGANMTLATISTVDGSRAHVGTMIGARWIEGLSFAVPEPTTLMLLLVGCAATVLRRR